VELLNSNLTPGRRCLPPAGWVSLVPRLPRWFGHASHPERAEAGPALMKTIESVQRAAQREIVYQTDQRNYGVEDRWEVPGVTTAIRVGDCEDFAFAKIHRLILKKVPPGALRLAICRAPVGTRQEAHAVLAIDTDLSTKIMDCRYPLPLSDDRLENMGIYDCRRLPYKWLAWSIPGEWFWWQRIC